MFVGALIAILLILPQWWVKKVFLEFGRDREDFPGTAGQFAEHLVERFEWRGVSVTTADNLSHFDPEKKVVVLSPQFYGGKSLTAITVAAHEIGHLIQLEQGNRWLSLRSQLIEWAARLDKIGVVAMFLMPLGAALTRSPLVMLLLMGSGFAGMLINVLAHLVTLPVELDASFGKALPLLIEGGYIGKEDEPGARRILTAAALTYLATALSGLLNLARWLRVLRR
ncbi:MAG: zinc metallopeptidase [Proteobacteria bacterium]|nr:zinc metallopeptidase [Pseudomonadota bacterium]